MVRDRITSRQVYATIPEEDIKPDKDTYIFINPDGLFIGGGPAVHAGLTGRKTAIDTYGEYARHSGAALSGKDPSRLDRCAAYAARHAAANVVAAGLATECELMLSYAIGEAGPVTEVLTELLGLNLQDIREGYADGTLWPARMPLYPYIEETLV